MLKSELNFRLSSFAANLKFDFMYSSEGFKRFYFRYQTEGVPKGILIQSCCLKNLVHRMVIEKLECLCWGYRTYLFSITCTTLQTCVVSIVMFPLLSISSCIANPTIYIVMSKKHRIVRIFVYGNRSYSLFVKKFITSYQFIKIERNSDDTVYKINRQNVVLLQKTIQLRD